MSMPVLKLRQVVGFPGNILGGTGIEATKLHGTVTIDMDWNEFGAIDAIPTAPTSYILTFDTATQAYVMVPSHLLGGAVAGIADVTSSGTFARQIGSWVPTVTEAPLDGTLYGRQSVLGVGTWVTIPSGGGGGIPEPANDGVQYGRKTAAGVSSWTPTLTDAVSDSHSYGRNNGAWARVVEDAASDGQLYARKNSSWNVIPPSIGDAASDGQVYGRQSGAWTAIGWSTSGSNIYNANAGNVGIGTSTPTGLLDVKVATNQHVKATTVGGVAFLSFLNDADNAYVPATINANPLILNGYGTSGNVGIGTISPTYPLHVAKSSPCYMAVETTAGSTGIKFIDHGRSDWSIGADFTILNAFEIRSDTAAQTWLSIDSASGNVTIPSSYLSVGGTRVTRFGGNTFYAVDYGVVADGATDNAAALQALVNAASALSSSSIWLPAGMIRSSAQISISLAANYHMSVHGQGSDATKLDFYNGTNGLVFELTASQAASVSVEGLSLLTGGIGTGSAIALQTSSGYNPQPGYAAQSVFFDVTCVGNDAYTTTNYWAYGFYINNVSCVNWTACTVFGPAAIKGTGILVQGNSAIPSYGVQYTVSQCNFGVLEFGFVYGEYVQGVFINQTSYTAVTFAIWVPSTGPGAVLAQLGVVNCQFFGTDFIHAGAALTGLLVSGNFTQVQSGTGGSAIAGPFNGSTIVGNLFAGGGTAAGIEINGGGYTNIITGNCFSSWTTGVQFDFGSTGNIVRNNVYNTVGTPAFDGSGTNTIGGTGP